MSLEAIYSEAEIVTDALVVTATYEADSDLGFVEVNTLREYKGGVSGLLRFTHDLSACGLRLVADEQVYLFLDHDGDAKRPTWVKFMRHKSAPKNFSERLERLVGSAGS